MQPHVSTEHLKQLILSLLPDVLTTYFQEKEKELYAIPLLERLIRLEEELKALRLLEVERHQALSRETDKRFEALLREMDKRFEAQQREKIARFEALEKRLNFMQWLIAIGFSFLTALMTLINFLK